MKVYQVTANWTVFRIPIKQFNDRKMYNEIGEWLTENCVGTYKLFLISYGIIGNSNHRKGRYEPLLEVDLLSDVDVMAFKLRWI